MTVRVPQRGDKKTLQETVARNAGQALVLHKTRRASDLTTRNRALEEIQEALWDLVWAGEVTNDAWAPLRAPRLALAKAAARDTSRHARSGRRIGSAGGLPRRGGGLVSDRHKLPRLRAHRGVHELVRPDGVLLLLRLGLGLGGGVA